MVSELRVWTLGTISPLACKQIRVKLREQMMVEWGNNNKEQISTTMTKRRQILVQGMGDPLSLQLSDHPGMVLVSASLVGTNFHSWSRAVRIALRAKMKLSFIEGTVSTPNKDFENYEKWKRYDFIVTSWILNSISIVLVDGFIYTVSGRDLWLEISERFSKCNGPMIYELHWKISLTSQDNVSVFVYFTKLKRFWDELGSIETLPACTCRASKDIIEITNRNKLMQFLMSLNNVFGSVRDQILEMDPLPTVKSIFNGNKIWIPKRNSRDYEWESWVACIA